MVLLRARLKRLSFVTLVQVQPHSKLCKSSVDPDFQVFPGARDRRLRYFKFKRSPVQIEIHLAAWGEGPT